MAKPVMFETPNGEKMVVLPLGDYLALVEGIDAEDRSDVEAFDEAMAALKDGRERMLTPDEMARFQVRPGFLRGVRKGKGLTQAQLAERAGITQGFLSDIEAGRRNASDETLRKVAEALGVLTGTEVGT